jgi:hypothetical protein
MTEANATSTKVLFDSLVKLYKQGQLLLLDADRIMGEKGWTPITSTILSGLSYALGYPERWYLRWATRFYLPTIPEDNKASITRIPFISIHFASDHDTKVDEPLLSAGWLLYSKPMDRKEAEKSWDYWMCKYWFYGKPDESSEGWHRTGQSQQKNNLRGTETFVVPLFDIVSSEKLEELVITPLLARYANCDR